MKAKVTELASSHVPMLSQPQRVYDVIVDAAASVIRLSVDRGPAKPGIEQEIGDMDQGR
jgi:hypothetical protein